MTAAIALLTDFGDRGTYVGQLRGVIQRLCPGTTVIDLTHQVRPQAVREGAFLLDGALAAFPDDTIYLCVVDPGVGTRRRAIALDLPGIGRFVGPDNGLFTPLLLRQQAMVACEINPVPLLTDGHEISATFHGRDLFAPVAARLARGMSFDQIGPTIDCATLIVLPAFWATARENAARQRQIDGEVVHIDSFGNLVTNIRRDLIADLSAANLATARITTTHHDCRGIHRTYGDAPAGAIIALFGSSGMLEIAQVNGRADRTGDGQPIDLGLTVTLTI